MRFEMQGEFQSLIDCNKKRKPVILAAWHGELFSIAGGQNQVDLRFAVMVSQSKDGEFIARIIERLGHHTVRGSSSRGGVRALIQAKKMMEKDNDVVVVTMDGPRGPRHKVKDGIIYLAQKTGALIFPVRVFPEKTKVFEKSWDRFELPYPFTRTPIYIGEGMAVTDEKLDKEVLKREKKRLEERMQALKPIKR
ncbi:hypothetical protein PSDVSF_03900 [Pseudodesulfovibrio sediminis]|uniref:DUF374 domain-containing protein n=2 Tax=Pseudodesulfovibrio sediminis TaxID=2810563 RepID=A0ABN6EQS0_9BACT|nr:hypothetical protein PSDVSF_03900 [Pseudodesulfovibrio sediminis]